MATINDGGPAFPSTHERAPSYVGMNLRDWFAGQALAGLLAQSNGTALSSDPSLGAEFSYALADAMLAAREVKP